MTFKVNDHVRVDRIPFLGIVLKVVIDPHTGTPYYVVGFPMSDDCDGLYAGKDMTRVEPFLPSESS